MIEYVLVFALLVFISSVSQVLLKKATQREYSSQLKMYLNLKVVFAYAIYVLVTLGTTLCFRHIPLSYGPIIEASGYIYVTVWGVFLFKERLNSKKILALTLIISGIIVYAI